MSGDEKEPGAMAGDEKELPMGPSATVDYGTFPKRLRMCEFSPPAGSASRSRLLA